MIDFYVLDAHSLIWHLEGNPKLGKRAKSVLDNADNKFILPIIALAEIEITVRKGRTMIPNVNEMYRDVFDDRRIEIQPLTLEILLESQNALAVSEMHD